MEMNKEIVEIVSDFCNYQAQKYPHHYRNMDGQIETGCDVIDKLIRIDGYTLGEIKSALEWAIHDDFWSPNVVTLTGLRKKSKSNGATKFNNIITKYKSTDSASKMRDFING